MQPPLTSDELVAEEVQLDPSAVCFTTARGFNASMQTPWRDDARALRDRVFPRRGMEPRSLIFAGQVHGASIVVVDDLPAGDHRIASCDGLVTTRRNEFLLIRTADCLPVALVDSGAGLAGVCHAGWRGTRANITGSLVETLVGLGASPMRLRGWIGPAISGDHYEVSPELIGEFEERFGHLGRFTSGRFLNLPRLNLLQAEAAGLPAGAMGLSPRCTYREADIFHSHRRQGRSRGHQYTVCGLLP